ncbi:hypothetical protein NPIL_193542 [Nephila pilipes]|uniref:Uncharacterized protein n=1 Tax=Nephila pilipes TaxID=299642 RepID=A0A8X6KR62_NEPPI|nr:hypothetical protein NPIL_193542 [Nephila pilipes]
MVWLKKKGYTRLPSTESLTSVPEAVNNRETTPCLAERSDIRQNLCNENGATSQSPCNAEVFGGATSVPSSSDYNPAAILSEILYGPPISDSALPHYQKISHLSRMREAPEASVACSLNRQAFTIVDRSPTEAQSYKKRVLWNLIIKSMKKIVNSKTCIFVLLLLLIMPISAFVQSAKYARECEVVTTSLVVLNGVVGFLLIICRLMTLSINHYFINLKGKEPRKMTSFLFFMLWALLVVVLFLYGLSHQRWTIRRDDYRSEETSNGTRPAELRKSVPIRVRFLFSFGRVLNLVGTNPHSISTITWVVRASPVV